MKNRVYGENKEYREINKYWGKREYWKTTETVWGKWRKNSEESCEMYGFECSCVFYTNLFALRSYARYVLVSKCLQSIGRLHSTGCLSFEVAFIFEAFFIFEFVFNFEVIFNLVHLNIQSDFHFDPSCKSESSNMAWPFWQTEIIYIVSYFGHIFLHNNQHSIW